MTGLRLLVCVTCSYTVAVGWRYFCFCFCFCFCFWFCFLLLLLCALCSKNGFGVMVSWDDGSGRRAVCCVVCHGEDANICARFAAAMRQRKRGRCRCRRDRRLLLLLACEVGVVALCAICCGVDPVVCVRRSDEYCSRWRGERKRWGRRRSSPIGHVVVVEGRERGELALLRDGSSLKLSRGGG